MDPSDRDRDFDGRDEGVLMGMSDECAGEVDVMMVVPMTDWSISITVILTVDLHC